VVQPFNGRSSDSEAPPSITALMLVCRRQLSATRARWSALLVVFEHAVGQITGEDWSSTTRARSRDILRPTRGPDARKCQAGQEVARIRRGRLDASSSRRGDMHDATTTLTDEAWMPHCLSKRAGKRRDRAVERSKAVGHSTVRGSRGSGSSEWECGAQGG